MKTTNSSETIAEIIADMRRGTKIVGYWRSCDLNEILQYHADRLEAAHKRECASVERDSSAMREALEVIVEIGEEVLEERSTATYPIGNMGWGAVHDMLDTARDALSAPANKTE